MYNVATKRSKRSREKQDEPRKMRIQNSLYFSVLQREVAGQDIRANPAGSDPRAETGIRFRLEVFAMEFGIVSDSRERTAIAFEADHNVWKRLAFDAVYKKSDEIWDQILLSQRSMMELTTPPPDLLLGKRNARTRWPQPSTRPQRNHRRCSSTVNL